MALNRRGFLKAAAGLVVAAGAGGVLVPERRVWALDRTMVGPAPDYDAVVRAEVLRLKRALEGAVVQGEGKILLMHPETAQRFAGLLSGQEVAVNARLAPDRIATYNFPLRWEMDLRR